MFTEEDIKKLNLPLDQETVLTDLNNIANALESQFPAMDDFHKFVMSKTKGKDIRSMSNDEIKSN